MAERGHANARKIAARLSRAKGFVLDLDGTMVLGDSRNKGLKPLPGALDFLGYLRERGTPFVLFTNGTVRPPHAYVDELAHADIKISVHEIMTPASVAAAVLSAKGYRRIMVLGGEGVSGPLADVGLEIVRPPDWRNVDAIFVGWFREFGMPDIEAACEAAWNGAPVYAASLVPYFATAGGRTLGTSCAIAGAIQKITGVRAKALGKPAAEAMRIAARRLGAAAKDLVVIGDDPDLEIPMALKAGTLAIGVTTGIAKHTDFAERPKAERADHIAENIGAVLALWRANV
jgi:NagD protein